MIDVSVRKLRSRIVCEGSPPISMSGIPSRHYHAEYFGRNPKIWTLRHVYCDGVFTRLDDEAYARAIRAVYGHNPPWHAE